MSYCRFGDADIYLFDSKYGIWCQCCTLAPASGKYGMRGDTILKTPQEALEHIKLHREHGDYVPEDVDKELMREIEEATK